MSKHLRLDFDGQRATITLDRVDKHNMLDAADLADFEDHLGRVDGAGDVRVLVVTGAGEAAFSSGFAHGDVAATDWRDNPIERLCARIEDARVPTVCALNGSVFGRFRAPRRSAAPRCRAGPGSALRTCRSAVRP